MAGQKIRKLSAYFALILLFVYNVWYLILGGRLSTYEFIWMSQCFLLVMLVRLLGQIKLPFTAYCLLYFLILGEKNLLGVKFYTIYAAFYIADLCLVIFLDKGRLRPYLTKISIASVCAAVMYAIYDILSSELIPLYYDIGKRYSMTAPQKALLIGAVSALFIMMYVALLKLLSRLLMKKKELFASVTDRFSGLEIYVFVFVALTTVLFSFISNNAYYELAYYEFEWTGYRKLMQAVVIFSDAAYIAMLLKAASIKEKMHIAEEQRNDAVQYGADLESNFENMRDIRHDVKNLFMTMGGFVDSSENEDMKKFYEENIAPFVRDTVAKSELQDKLSILRDDALKYFLYYKATQLIEKGVNTSLEILSPFTVDFGCADMVRIMGIFIDNAAEEAVLTNSKKVSIKISEGERRHIVLVSNSVRESVKEKGIVAGTTEKGLGRGNGLLIAQRITAKYNNTVTNSYFTDDEFVQCLMIEK